MRRRSVLLALVVAALVPACVHAQDCTIGVDANKSLGEVSPYVYGQFIRSCI